MAGLTRFTIPPVTTPPVTSQSSFVLAAARLGFPGRWHTCTCGAAHCPHAASARRCRSARCSPVSSPIRSPPSASHVTTSRSRAVLTAASNRGRA